MGDWTAASLAVIGRRVAVDRFARDAQSQVRAAPRLRKLTTAYRRPQPKDVFDIHMIVGYGGPLMARPLESLGRGFYRKDYDFEIKYWRDHFEKVSRRYPRLDLILTYHFPATEDFGSYLLRAGRSQLHRATDATVKAMFDKHGYDYLSDEVEDEDENEWRWTEASWELMDAMQTSWIDPVYKRLGIFPNKGKR